MLCTHTHTHIHTNTLTHTHPHTHIRPHIHLHTQQEQELRLREEQFSSQTSDHDYHVKQEESRLQAWEDMLHMRKKDLDHREFDLRNAMPSTGVESSAQMAELASR